MPGFKYKVSIRNNSSDIPLFGDMFIRREYEVPFESDVATIIDCGANVGLASLYFLSKFPDVKIIAVEPEEYNFKLLTENLGRYKNVTCIKKGIWNKKAHLEIIDNGGGNHAFTVIESQIKSKNSIEGISIDDIINDFQLESIDILKIDIEGSEEQVFTIEPKWLNKVKIIFCEIHEKMKPDLTNKITSMLSPCFNISMNGEYHVFKRKGKI